ncbi:proline--tRNA ligase [Paenibacillus sp. WLX2291]|uniref:proline--tRNA ligase n=1 Tax=Paenibacillus sp. WLX2291 TaxID=3296934 RepID=UPI003983F867
MKQSQLLGHTLREHPADAEVASHRLLLRAGYIRQVAAGIYTHLPLAQLVLQRVEQIIREELNRAGLQELHLPVLHPAELWQESGRYDTYGSKLMRFADRHGRDFVLGPTHEEVITDLIRNEIRSYRQLPLRVYQIQTKFRDENRPRFGLLRGREFTMKDAYSFDSSREALRESYMLMYEAYHRIFERCGLNFRAVEADAGSIGGDGWTHEFMALTDVGEDTIASCTHCQYAANMEKAEYRLAANTITDAHTEHDTQVDRFPTDNKANSNRTPFIPEKIHTPHTTTISQLSAFLNVKASAIIKTLVCIADGQPLLVVVRGDHEINEIKLQRAVQAEQLSLADHDTVVHLTGVPVGFLAPYALEALEHNNLRLLVDHAVYEMEEAICGGNEADYHYAHIVPSVHLSAADSYDLRNVQAGDHCPRCAEGTLQLGKGIELGHVFELGTRYSEVMQARVHDQHGEQQTLLMGCYGIGVSRLLSAIIEQHHDEDGIRWPIAVAPYDVHLIPVSVKDEQQYDTALQLYEQLRQHGVSVLLDDRDERAGVKFKDADLIGIPVRLVIGKGITNEEVEWIDRATRERRNVQWKHIVKEVISLKGNK